MRLSEGQVRDLVGAALMIDACVTGRQSFVLGKPRISTQKNRDPVAHAFANNLGRELP
jgi:hypothetical protein